VGRWTDETILKKKSTGLRRYNAFDFILFFRWACLSYSAKNIQPNVSLNNFKKKCQYFWIVQEMSAPAPLTDVKTVGDHTTHFNLVNSEFSILIYVQGRVKSRPISACVRQDNTGVIEVQVTSDPCLNPFDELIVGVYEGRIMPRTINLKEPISSTNPPPLGPDMSMPIPRVDGLITVTSCDVELPPMPLDPKRRDIRSQRKFSIFIGSPTQNISKFGISLFEEGRQKRQIIDFTVAPRNA